MSNKKNILVTGAAGFIGSNFTRFIADKYPDVELFLVLNKDILDRSAWEEGMRLLEREPDWNLLKNQALIYTTDQKIPYAISD
jgi:dTDP-glucose 4,6-dehydratase